MKSTNESKNDEWKTELRDIIEPEHIKKQRQDVENKPKIKQFYEKIVAPAFNDLKRELETYNKTVCIKIYGFMGAESKLS